MISIRKAFIKERSVSKTERGCSVAISEYCIGIHGIHQGKVLVPIIFVVNNLLARILNCLSEGSKTPTSNLECGMC